MTSGPDLIREINDAIERQDLEAISKRLHSAVVWRHNIGSGSPEEGEYQGRENVLALVGRIMEPWEYIRPTPHEVRDLGDGVFRIRGELKTKHKGVATEIATPYEQRVVIHDGLLARGEMVFGSEAHALEPRGRG